MCFILMKAYLIAPDSGEWDLWSIKIGILMILMHKPAAVMVKLSSRVSKTSLADEMAIHRS